jgi:hypothetical protein
VDDSQEYIYPNVKNIDEPREGVEEGWERLKSSPPLLVIFSLRLPPWVIGVILRKKCTKFG